MAERSNDHVIYGSDSVIQTAKQIANLYNAVDEVAAQDPCFAFGAEKAKEGILEMHAALVTPRLMPRLEINIPMPPGAAIPARSPAINQHGTPADPIYPAPQSR
jgi:hypothetical protein